jgi:hypothetical protein
MQRRTTVPISAELNTGIAGDLFPLTIKLTGGILFLTEPVALFLMMDIGIQLLSGL